MASNVEKLVEVLVAGFQPIEDTLRAIKAQRSVDHAVGAQLNQLGKLVDQLREGLEDEDYRRFVRARIATNKSKGAPLDVLKVARLIVNDPAARFVIQHAGTASYTLRVADITIDVSLLSILIRFLREATAAGVRATVQGSDSAIADRFNFSDGPGRGFAQLPQLDLAPLTATIETVVRHRDSRIPTLALVADGAGAGTLTNAGDAWTFHFQSGVTTVANFEAAIDASTALILLTLDGVGTLGAGDVLAATPFIKTVTGGKLVAALE